MLLDQSLKDSMVVIGTATYGGAYTARKNISDSVPSTHELVPAPLQSFEIRAHNLNLDAFLFVGNKAIDACADGVYSMYRVLFKSVGGYITPINFIGRAWYTKQVRAAFVGMRKGD
jgi:hypothetical protein